MKIELDVGSHGDSGLAEAVRKIGGATVEVTERYVIEVPDEAAAAAVLDLYDPERRVYADLAEFLKLHRTA